MREPKVPAFFVPLHSLFYSLFVIMLAIRCIACFLKDMYLQRREIPARADGQPPGADIPHTRDYRAGRPLDRRHRGPAAPVPAPPRRPVTPPTSTRPRLARRHQGLLLPLHLRMALLAV